MSKLSKARDYVLQNKDKVNNEYRLNYHVMAEIGWINDPNGFVYYNGEYHLFYQYYPYDSAWGPMHWGHVKSKDLVKWECLPVALAPDMYYDADGCFSGSAIEKDGKLYLMYTGHTNPDVDNPENIRQIQNIAVSEDGIEFKKVKHNPVISTRDLPENALPQDFRDPKVFKRGEEYYVVIGSRHQEGDGQLLLYKSKDLLNWAYVGVLARSENNIGKMWECPDLFQMGEHDVLVISPQFLERDGDKYCNLYSSVYILGNCDFKNCKFDFNTIDEIDSGFDFYAPQTLVDNKGRRILIAWMQMWERNVPTHDKGHKWAGAMTLPRELKIFKGKLYQYPVEEMKNYRANHVSYKAVIVKGTLALEKIEGQSIELELEIDSLKANKFGLKVLKDEENQTVMYYDRQEGKFIFDRSNSGEILRGSESEDIKDVRRVKVSLLENKLKLRIFIDRISVEVFIQEGERVITSTVYPKSTAKAIEFFSDEKILIKTLNKWDIRVKEEV
ncbi:glycoside hydrolase family 32 protein [Clostridium sp. SYSU_GA19001]|uniref:glycoside hydrolase family 32 protein n=1 Tax=Clostridium caldaquaticum TaxID=2940653 RepID=UPI002077364A|nr:glycoside hydrolase family 32 protein [Clostridium caldaquaticum]MCM8711217.1 glycoside hydrolase family 32 protein [Clostridium caldaquaticum]